MKRSLICLSSLFLLVICAYSQDESIEKGDKEFTVNGFIITGVGDASDFASGQINATFGYYVFNLWEIGIGPGLSISYVNDETEWNPSGTFFTAVNFTAKKKAIPYFKVSWYQSSFDIEEGMDFMDYSFVQGGFGLKAFLNPHLAWDTSINYGINVTEPSVGIIMFITGLNVIF